VDVLAHKDGGLESDLLAYGSQAEHYTAWRSWR